MAEPVPTAMRKSRIASLALTAAAVVMLLAALPFVRSLPDSTWFDKPEAEEARAYSQMHEAARRGCGIEEYWTFDEPSCVRSRSGAIAAGTRVSKGRFGHGLKFDGGNGAVFWTGRSWRPGTNGFTVAMWVKAKELPSNQDIFCTWAEGHMGFRIFEGRMRFDYLKGEGGICAVGYDFSGYGRFVHLAAVADPADRTVSIYEDGELKDRTVYPEFDFDVWNWISFGKGSLHRNRFPFNGVIDEAAIWNRPLGSAEIVRLASAGQGLDALLAPPGARFRCARRHARAVAMRFLGGLFLSGTPDFRRMARAASARSGLGSVSLSLPDSGWRRLARAHARSMRSGCRSSGAANKVDAVVSIGGVSKRCLVSLGGGTTTYPAGARMPYVVEPAPGDPMLPGGFRRLELDPPEYAGWTVPVFASEVRKAFGLAGAMRLDCQVARLSVNGLDRGCYLVRDMSRDGVAADGGIEVFVYEWDRHLVGQHAAESSWISPGSLDEATAALASLLRGDMREAVMARLSAAEDAIWDDGFSPVPRVTRGRMLDNARASCVSAVRDAGASDAASAVGEEVFLSSNLSPWRIEGDLDFASIRDAIPEDWSISFKSSAPSVISDEGAVTRPQGSPAFVDVSMSLARPQGGEVRRTLKFRVMPSDCAVPALHVWTAIPFGRICRTSAMVEVSGGGRQYADFSLHAGIRYRGNSSFLGKRRLINIKTDSPHGIFDGSPTRHLLGINATTDALHVWNQFAMDLFRSFPRDDGASNMAPRIFHAELFVNGRYRCLQEFAERIDGSMFGRDDIAVFRHQIARPRTPFFRQTFPEPDKADLIPEYQALEKYLASKPEIEGLGQLAAKVDLASVADLHILFSLLGNTNGSQNRFWFQETLVYDAAASRFQYVPWDFDDTAKLSHIGIVETDFTRMANDHGFREFRRDRWNALRKGPLSEDILVRRFDEILAPHIALLPTESLAWEKSEPRDGEAFALMAEKGRAYIRSQLARLDDLYNNR